jgi:hypothetical protein
MLANRTTVRVAVAAVASGLLAAGAVALPAAASASTSIGTVHYGFRTLDNANDVTFNQLLGINDAGLIAGYFGSGAQDHPNKGYLLLPGHGRSRYFNENFPGSVQTQVTGLNNRGVTVGFWSDTNNANLSNANFGFYAIDGHFHTVNVPTSENGTPPVNQLLGVNDHDIAVGFWTDAQGVNHGYEYNIRANTFTPVLYSPAPQASVTATAINNEGDVAGFAAGTSSTVGFIRTRSGHITSFAFPGSSSTMALGINQYDEVVGTYTIGTSMHGFTWTQRGGFTTVDDPQGAGTTTINGVNEHGSLVGFYVDGNGNTDGFLANPNRF